MTTTAVVTLLALTSPVMERVLAAPDLGTFVHASAGVCSGFLLAGMILLNRRRVAQAPEADPAQPVPGAALAGYWHYPALVRRGREHPRERGTPGRRVTRSGGHE